MEVMIIAGSAIAAFLALFGSAAIFLDDGSNRYFSPAYRRTYFLLSLVSIGVMLIIFLLYFVSS